MVSNGLSNLSAQKEVTENRGAIERNCCKYISAARFRNPAFAQIALLWHTVLR